jgi:hypothetical protein
MAPEAPVDGCGELGGGWGWLGGTCVVGPTAAAGPGLTSTAGAAACDPLGGVGLGFTGAVALAGEPELP